MVLCIIKVWGLCIFFSTSFGVRKSACLRIVCTYMNRNLPWSCSRARNQIISHSNTFIVYNSLVKTNHVAAEKKLLGFGRPLYDFLVRSSSIRDFVCLSVFLSFCLSVYHHLFLKRSYLHGVIISRRK